MKPEIFTLSSSVDGLLLSTSVTRPEGTPKGIVQLVHGMIEHKERYFGFMEWLSEHGYACVMCDNRGHGASVRSEKDLGHLKKGDSLAMVEDVKTVGDWARKEFGDLPFTLLGHSMGSLIVRCYLKRYDNTIDRLIVSGSPSDNPAKGAGKVLAHLIGTFMGYRRRSKLLKKISFAGYNTAFEKEGYDRAWVCSDPEILKDYHSDPLCNFNFTVGAFLGLFGLLTDCYSGKGWKLSKPDMPIRFKSGALDPCRKSDEAWQSSVDFISGLGYTDVKGVLYPGMRHEILLEKDKMTVWNDILSEL